MPLEKDNIYEFGFGRSDSVSKNVNLLDEAVFSFIYGGLFKVLKSLELSSILDLEIVFRLYINFLKGLSFYDIHPQKKTHALVIPKGEYIDLDDFTKNASGKEIIEFIKGITLVAKKLGISSETGKGYRALANIGENGGQEVPHLHFHLLGGEKVGKIVSE